MWDNILDFYEDHRKLCITVGVIVVVLAICLGIRHHNLSKKNANEPSTDIADLVEVTEASEEVVEVNETEEEKSTYVSNIGLQYTEEETEETESIDPESLKYKEEKVLDVFCDVIGHTVVPTKNMDGSSCRGYLNKISITDFDTFFGTHLTHEDLMSDNYILVGTESDKDGDLKSTGWLQANLGSIDDGTPVYFTNLHVIGSLSDERVVLLCSYDWYSAFGLKDTLVLFEDISGSLNTKDYIDGDVISTIVWAKNIKVEKVNGQNVVHIEYALEG